MTTEETTIRSVKIGELLIGVGALTTGDLTEAIQISRRMGVPIGRVLVMSGCVSEDRLKQALELQSLVKDGLCDLDIGMKALSKVFKEKIDLKTALKQLNWAPKQDANSNKLGELLIDSNIVSRSQLDRALEASFQSGMPLGGTLVLQGVLSAQLLPTILHTQEQIRENKLSRGQALNELQQALIFWARADQSKDGDMDLQGNKLPTKNVSQSPFDQTPVAQKNSSTAAVQTPVPQLQPGSKRSPQPFNQNQAANSPQPNADTRAPNAVNRAGDKPFPLYDEKPQGWVQSQDSMTAVPMQHAGGVNKPTVPAVERPQPIDLPNAPVSLVELMKLSGYCTQNTIEHATQQALNDSRLAAKMFLAIGFVDATTLNNFVYCQALIAKGSLRTDQAMYVLNQIRHRKISLEEALGELGIPASVLP